MIEGLTSLYHNLNNQKGTKVKLEILERTTLQQILPRQGDSILTMRTVRDLRRKLEFTEEEITNWNMHRGDPNVHIGGDENLPMESPDAIYWNNVDTSAEFEFSAKQREEVVKAIEKLAEDGELTEAHLSLCDKFGLE